MNTTRVKLAALLFLALSPATVAKAAVKNWIAGNGNWNVPGNWSPAGVPGAGDDVKINLNVGVPRTVTYDYPGPPITLASLGVNNTSAAAIPATLSIAANNLTAGELDVGWSGFGGSGGAGVFTQSGGVTTVSGAGLYVGVNATDVGTYNLSGTASLVASITEVVGSSGTGVFNHSAGTNSITGANNLYLGFSAGSNGTYTISGGSLTVGNGLVVGNGGTGTLSVQGTGSVSTNNLSINAASTVNLNGGTLRFNTIGGAGGLSRLNYTAGTIQLAGGRTFDTDVAIKTLFGATPTIPIGKGLAVEGSVTIGDGTSQTVRVDGGSLSIGGLLAIGSFSDGDNGQLEIVNGGNVTNSAGAYVGWSGTSIGTVIVSGPNSIWNPNGISLGDGVLNIRDSAQVNCGSLIHHGVINLDGGTIRFDGYAYHGTRVFNFYAGTIQLIGNRSIGTDEAVLGALGSAPTLTSGKCLTVEGTATLLTSVTVDGGTFSVGSLTSAEELQLVRGTLSVTNQAVTIGFGGVLGSDLDVNEDMTVNVTLGITNQGLVTGDGQIGGPFTNAATGELRAQAGRSLRLTGSGNTNAGQIKLLSGELEFTQNLTNSAGAFISGNGSLIVVGGLVNQGTMNFAGTANIDGAVNNAVGGKIISGGGGATIFYDDVTNNGEIRTSTNGFTVFFGSVSGSGSFTGTGNVNFEGDLGPGSSPAAVNFAGDVVFGPESTLQIELGGTAAGTQYDQINVAGDLTLDGTLQISLINGFTPSAGQTFDILNWGSLAGAFSSIELPTLPGLSWNASQLTAGILSVAIPGDFNLDNTVNAADYVMWRKTDGSPAGYNTWRTNFGRTAGSGSASNDTVPEPTTGFLLVLGVAIGYWRATRTCLARSKTRSP